MWMHAHNVYGPYEYMKEEKKNWPPYVEIALAEEGDSVEVWGDGRQRRSFFYRGLHGRYINFHNEPEC